MRKWDDPPSPFADPAHDSPPEDEPVRHRARAFRRWLARGADPGGLRAHAGEQPGGPDAARERPAVRDLLAVRRADEAHLPPPHAVEQSPAPGASQGEQPDL